MEVVSLLLADMRIDVNKQHSEDCTPFVKACENGREEIVALLLPDPRVNINTPADDFVHSTLVCLSKWPPVHCAAHLGLWQRS